MKQYDIIIVGAGPAGLSAALTLQKSRHKVALIEKSEFPRNKTCGDAICDRSINTLKKISESYYSELMQTLTPQEIKKTALVYNGKLQVLSFKNYGYTLSRKEYDNFLFELVKRDCKNIDIFQNTKITSCKKKENSIVFISNKIETFEAKVAIIADGAKSKLTEELTNASWKNENNGIGIRAYYSNVEGIEPNTIELYYNKKYFPGYFWIFPLKNNIANVGFGYHMKNKAKSSESIHEIFSNWIEKDVDLKNRFKNSKLISKIQGGLIPYNNNKFNIAGNNYMITGDSASLIDPISGGGIGSAMYSGHIAAEQAEKCCTIAEYGYNHTKLYENFLKKRVAREMKIRHTLQQRLLKSPWVLDLFAKMTSSSLILQKFLNWYLKQ